MYIFARHFYLLWLFDERGLLGYIFFIFIYGGAIVGAILGFMDKNMVIIYVYLQESFILYGCYFIF